jgi:MOSC domain-containing protein YiiM
LNSNVTRKPHADLKLHGGLEKAIHHYCADHMAFWKAEYPDMAEAFEPGCFGENISSEGLDENNLCLGDVLSIGTVHVQVCQGRQPCWKLNAHLGLDSLATVFLQSGRTGWYYRIIKEGTVSLGDAIELVERPYPNWPLSRLIEARFSKPMNAELAKELAEMEVLSKIWRDAFLKRSSRS